PPRVFRASRRPERTALTTARAPHPRPHAHHTHDRTHCRSPAPTAARAVTPAPPTPTPRPLPRSRVDSNAPSEASEPPREVHWGQLTSTTRARRGASAEAPPGSSTEARARLAGR